MAVTEFTTSGLVIGTLADYTESLTTRFRDPSMYGENLRTADMSPGSVGQHIRLMAELLSSQAALLGSLASNANPETALDSFLKEAVQYNGITVQQKVYSTVTLQCTAGAAGCTIPAGRQVSDGAGTVFAVDSETVLTVSEVALVAATAIEEGPVVAAAGTLTTIDQPVYGWLSVTNPDDANVGQYEESAPALKRRRREAAAGVGGGSAAYIEKKLRDLDEVTDVAVSFNKTTKVLRTVIDGGATNSTIAECLYRAVAGGTVYDPTATIAVSYTDPDVNQSDTIRFMRAVEKPVYIVFEVEKKDGYESVGGNDTVINRCLEYFDGNLEVEGENVPRPRLGETLTAAKVSLGPDSVDHCIIRNVYIGFSASPTSSEDLSMEYWWRATTSAAYITVNEVA